MSAVSVTGVGNGSSVDKLTPDELKILKEYRQFKEKKKAKEWQPLQLADFTPAVKCEVFNALYNQAIEYFNGRKSGEIHEDNDYPQYTFEAVLMFTLGKDVFKALNKF